MEEPVDENNQKISKYNSAVAQLYRIDGLWQLATYNQHSGNLMQWNWILDGIFLEFAGDIKPEDDVQSNQIENAISKSLDNRNKLYQILKFKHRFLKKLENKQGKGTAYKDSSEDDFD